MVIAFEDPDDAQEVAKLLESTFPYRAVVSRIETSALRQYCASSGPHTRLQIEATGSMFLPPRTTLRELDVERYNKLRRGYGYRYESADINQRTNNPNLN